MRTRKFIADDVKSALEQIKRELGPDAMIVATRPVRRGLLGTGIEVTAADDGPSFGPRSQAVGPAPASPATLTDGDVDRLTAPLRAELRALGGRIRGAAPAEAPRGVEMLRSELGSLRRAVERLAHERVIEPISDALVAQPGLIAGPAARILALVGPTGVGKTTTIAKLAARAALVERQSVALVTLDTFRIGAEEQLRAYADLIGIPLVLCRDAERLGDTLRRLHHVGRVFIDTPGYGPRERGALQTLGDTLGGVPELELHLTLAAGTAPAEIDRAAERYRTIGASRLLFTKLDEVIQLEEIVRAPLRLGMPLRFVTTGQRVPEDLEEPDAARLLGLAQGDLDLCAEAA